MDLGQADPAHAYFMPAVRRILADGLAEGRAKRVFNLGCGNCATAQTLAAEGCEVAGVDPSEEGIAHAYASGLDPARRLGLRRPRCRVPTAPRSCSRWRWSSMSTSHTAGAASLRALTEPGGLAIAPSRHHPPCAVLSTPYHGYWKKPPAQPGAGRLRPPPPPAARPRPHQVPVGADLTRAAD
jgi:SAM-dependent methyltransferase